MHETARQVSPTFIIEIASICGVTQGGRGLDDAFMKV
jgi:hypothetical protein